MPCVSGSMGRIAVAVTGLPPASIEAVPILLVVVLQASSLAAYWHSALLPLVVLVLVVVLLSARGTRLLPAGTQGRWVRGRGSASEHRGICDRGSLLSGTHSDRLNFAAVSHTLSKWPRHFLQRGDKQEVSCPSLPSRVGIPTRVPG
eukprot:1496039-Rhodomonas_salina.1